MDNKTVVTPRPRKSTGFAGFLGMFPFGLGALYNGQIAKFVLYLVVFAGLISTMDNHSGGAFVPFLFVGFIFFQFFDNIHSARAINEAAAGEPIAQAGLLPEDIVSTGSTFWGAFLIVLGLVLIMVNFEVVALDALADFWPVVVILIGAKLVYDSVVKSKKGN
jgi:ABC-type polysaccharide/polyol phosphate export permease